MANMDWAHGLWPLTTQHGGPYHTRQMIKDAAENAIIYPGDVISREDDGKITPGGTPGTTLYDGVSLDYGAALTLTNHLVVVDPLCVFEAQDDGDGLDEIDEGLNCNLVFNAGNSVTGRSGHEIDGSTKATSNALDLHLEGLLSVQNNNYGANARFEVLINKHRRAHGVAGV